MPIQSYFYDSIVGDERTYSAADFARAFDIILDNGIILNSDGTTGFDSGGVSFTTIYAGKAVVEGRLIEVIDTEILTVPAGSYAGQIVIRVDMEDAREATLVVKMDQNPVKDVSLYELPLYNATVVDGVIQSVSDLRTQGGATGKANLYHNHAIGDITNLQTTLNSKANSTNVYTKTEVLDLLNDQPLLWGGSSLMNDTVTLTPTKPISQCKNGWILIWSDYNDGGVGAQDLDIVHSVVTKYSVNEFPDRWHMFQVPSFQGSDPSLDLTSVKSLQITDTQIKGHARNLAEPKDVVLRRVLEW